MLLEQYILDGHNMLLSPLVPAFWRPPTDNDIGNGMHEWALCWKDAWEKTILTASSIIETDSCVQLNTSFKSNKPDVEYRVNYWIDTSGSFEVAFSFMPGESELPNLPRLGFSMKIPEQFKRMHWYGRGPHETYRDRKESGKFGVFSGLVWEQLHPYSRPQESGNKSDLRWVSLVNKQGLGLRVSAPGPFSSSAWQLDREDLDYVNARKGSESASGLVPLSSKHGGELKPRDFITWNIDYLHMGLGGDNSWGRPVHEQYRIPSKAYEYRLFFTPVRAR